MSDKNSSKATSSSSSGVSGGKGSSTSISSGSGTTLGRIFAAREWLSPTLKSSRFLSHGVLTPEEFVAAGDELVFRCPTWTWERGTIQRSHLPADKQYLMTRSVPCPSRVEELESMHVLVQENDESHSNNNNNNNIDGEEGDDGDWMISQLVRAVGKQASLNSPAHAAADEHAIEDDFDILDEQGEVVVVAPSPQSQPQPQPPPPPETELNRKSDIHDDDEDEYADMEDLEDDTVIQDNAVLAPLAMTNSSITTSQAQTGSAHATSSSDTDNRHFVQVRTYDLSITYDKYYQTPRLWMVGYDSQGQPLATEEMMQDVMQDYAHKTVTMERHPHLSHSLHASIHPCRHAQVMKTIVHNLMMNHNESKADTNDGTITASDPDPVPPPTVESYLFIFLKFVSSIIPTINYDFTVNVRASTLKL